MSDKKLTILDDAGSDAEWRLGYIDTKPALGDSQGRWYIVEDEAVVPQPSQQLVWFLQDGQWSCLHQMHWDKGRTPPTSPDTWLQKGPAFIEG